MYDRDDSKENWRDNLIVIGFSLSFVTLFLMLGLILGEMANG